MQKRSLPNSLKKITYKDFDISFRRHPSTGKLLVKKDDDVVKQAVKNLILTDKYERPYHPEFGGNIRARLFDNFDSISKEDFQNKINTAIENYEPRVQLISEDDKPTVTIGEFQDENRLFVTVRFRNVSTLNDIALDINLNRVR
jgi:phage baseplate assembly protein W